MWSGGPRWLELFLLSLARTESGTARYSAGFPANAVRWTLLLLLLSWLRVELLGVLRSPSPTSSSSSRQLAGLQSVQTSRLPAHPGLVASATTSGNAEPAVAADSSRMLTHRPRYIHAARSVSPSASGFQLPWERNTVLSIVRNNSLRKRLYVLFPLENIHWVAV